MMDPVQGVIKTGGVERRRSEARERLRRLYADMLHASKDDEENDTVDISDEARQRSDGTYRKSILEHVEGDE